jgi:hypothetical protein
MILSGISSLFDLYEKKLRLKPKLEPHETRLDIEHVAYILAKSTKLGVRLSNEQMKRVSNALGQYRKRPIRIKTVAYLLEGIAPYISDDESMKSILKALTRLVIFCKDEIDTQTLLAANSLGDLLIKLDDGRSLLKAIEAKLPKLQDNDSNEEQRRFSTIVDSAF